MVYATFRKWLAEHGCRFDTQSEKRGEGHGTVTIHRAGRTTELPLVGASRNLDPRSVRQVCEALGLENAGAIAALGSKRIGIVEHNDRYGA
jgi:hypothetical protein